MNKSFSVSPSGWGDMTRPQSVSCKSLCDTLLKRCRLSIWSPEKGERTPFWLGEQSRFQEEVLSFLRNALKGGLRKRKRPFIRRRK